MPLNTIMKKKDSDINGYINALIMDNQANKEVKLKAVSSLDHLHSNAPSVGLFTQTSFTESPV